MQYVGGDRPAEDEVTWRWPNQPCIEQMPRKLGFREATKVGDHTGRVRPDAGAYKRATPSFTLARVYRRFQVTACRLDRELV